MKESVFLFKIEKKDIEASRFQDKAALHMEMLLKYLVST